MTEELPLSYAQQRLWFLDQLEPNTAFYNIPIALRLVGTLDRAALEQSFQEIILRHEALRTNFITVDGKPTQIIQTETSWTVSVVECESLPLGDQEIATEQLVQKQALLPFELAEGALIRATLIVLSKTEHVLLVCMHHIVSDAWSLGVFISELAALYNAYAQGQPSPLAPLPIQYADFAIWQREWLQGDVLQTQLSYWQQQLKDAPALLPLPTDRPRPAVQTFNGANLEFALSVELTNKLTKLSQKQGCTLFMTLLAAFDTLLYRYTGQSDILVGSPIANRDHSEIEELIGFFVNTLVMRTDLSGNPSFSELLGRVREMALGAYAHQELPFEMLVEALQPERDLSHTPLFQVMFVLQNAPMSGVKLTGLTISSLSTESKTAKFDLTLSMHQSAAGLAGVWEYNTDLFDASTIERMARHFVTLLEGIVANPEERISQLPLLTEVEQHQSLVEWNSTQADYSFDKCIHQLFEEQVQRTPDAVAAVFDNQQLTYKQLNCRANQLAHYLQTLGVKPDMLVGICVERSMEMLVGLLGILKAGGAYLPLDPEYPIGRLNFILADAQVSLLLTQQRLIDRLPQHQAKQVFLDEASEQITQNNQDNPNSGVRAFHLANVIYTSGSTGEPKGVMVEHKGLCNLAQAQIQTFGLTSDSCVLQFASLSFDASISEILMALGSGATLYLGTKDSLLPGKPLIEQLRHHCITHVTLPPSALAVMPVEELPALQTIIVAGEASSAELIKQWSVGRNFFNAYGPTEASVCATIGKATPKAIAKCNDKEKISIGKAIANAQVYILDEYLQPVPIGVPGELHIGGVGLARGYLNRPQLTKEKFIPNPFYNSKFKIPFEKASLQNSKLYKTGDLARYLPDGNIEYLGRIDNQVKIRGFRIELGEIEAVLSQHEDLQACCVIAREDNPGDKRLVAYVVGHKQHPPTISQLRAFLSSQLPTYMIPHTFVMLESLPLTPNGKVDHRALKAPDSREGLEVSFVAPRTRIEETLAQIWASVLKVEQLGIHDNFFELGGDSILSIQIVARANQLGIVISPKQLFVNQTISKLAAVAGTTEAIKIEQGLVRGRLPLTPIQKWLFEQNLEQPHHYNQAFLLSVPSEVKPELLKPALQQLLLHHDALRLRYTQTDSTWQQIHSNPTDNIALCDIDLSALPENEQKAAIETQAACLQASLNLSENLIQVALFHLGIDKRARLLIIIHHLVVDGVSWRILLEDLQTAYQQLAQGKELVLPTKTTSFKDWSNKLTQLAQSNALKQEAAYWLNNSRTCIPPIPVDHRQQTNTVVSTNTVSVVLNEIETRALLQDVPKAYNTQINDVLLTALGLVLSKWTNSSSVLFNLEGHGREDIVDGVDLSRTIGWFTTIFPVVLQLPATKNLADAIKSVKEQLRAIPNKGIGYGLLRYLSQDADIAGQLQALPIAQISFNYLGQFDQLLNTSSWMQQAFESTGGSHGLENNRPHLLDINSVIAGERLQIDWTYSTNIHQHTTIESLAQEFVLTLQELIAHCSSPENVGYTPTDFELAKLNQLELDQLLASLGFQNQSGKTNWRNIEDIYPLSPMQQGMLFESLYAPSEGVYFEQFSFTLSGSLNVKAFEQAWQQVVARHSILRTAFIWEQLTQPLQVVYRSVDVQLQFDDWQQLEVHQQQQQLEQHLHSQRQQGFQLSVAPLMHLDLIQLRADSYQFIWNHHHLLLDGWSMPLVLQDLLQFYGAISQGETLALQPTPSYRNYVAWLQKQDLTKAEEFWQQKLFGFSAPTPLIVDKPSSNQKQQYSIFSEQKIQLTAKATTAIQTFARQHQLTINNLVQATWALLLCRYSQETDVVFGATVSGRPPELVGIESMVGIFINTLPVRVQVWQDTQVLDLLKDLQAHHVESEQYSYSSLVEIQGLSDVPNGTPLFESIVVFENYPVDEAVQSQNYSFSIDNFHAIEKTNYPLTLIAAPGEQLLVKISYDTSRFDDAVITRLLGHFQTLLAGIVANAEQSIWQLPLLTLPEQQQLLVEWNQTQAEYPIDKCLHQLFEEQVARTPDAVAVVFENEQLTYYQLNTRANQLAHYLQSLGVKPDVLVGICVERSIDMIVGLLGILKAGGAYLPLDPQYPTERLIFMLEDAHVSVLLTQDSLQQKIYQYQGKLICLDTDAGLVSQFSQDNFICGVEANNLGYVIYTSGSTGKPKGVAMSQLALANLIFWHVENLKVSPGAKTLQFSPISFDASFHEMFTAWHSGGTLVLITEELRLDPVALLALMEDKAIERLFIPFVGLQQLAEVAVSKALFTTHLREIITAGEQLQITPAISHWLSKLTNDCTLHNHYGPSESHVVTAFTLTNSVETWPLLPPIGRPIANTQIYILDKYLQPVPIGVVGELYIGGVALAQGYLNRPELTQQRFIPNPFNADPDSRLYKTGDLTRYLPDGNVEFLGRIDDQVKVRGFRIELGEIEAVLSQHGDVEGCCVIAREDLTSETCTELVALSAASGREGSQSKRLVAYVVAHQDCKPTINQLRQFLKTKLPEYMIPNAFVMLESLPITPSGKVDRRALPTPDFQSTNSDKYVAPRSPIEEMLSLIWAQVLKVELVGINDNFFELGGHSLLATQLVSRIRNIFKVELPLRELFAASTVGELARSLEQLQQQNLELVAPPILSRTENAPLPLSYAQQRLWFLDQLQPNSALYNIPLALRLIGTLDRVAFEQSLIEIINRHEVLRTNLITVDGQSSQIIRELLTENSQQGIVSIVDLKHLPTSEQEIATQQLAQQEAQKSFDLASEPLVRVILVVLSETEQVLSVCMHHIVSDGWSTGVFVQELAALYNAYSQGQPSPLAPLPIQYADFAIWQREWLQGDVLQTQLLYWQQQLKDAPALLMLPTDRPRPAVQTFNGAYLEFALSEELTQKLTKLSQQQGCTLFMTLLAAYDTLLYRYTGTDDILVGSPIANRNRLEIEGLIGFFINTLVLRTNLAGDPSFNELLSGVRLMAMDAYAHQDLPFEMLVEALQPERNMGHTPLFQVMFVLQNAPISGVELAGLTISSLNAQSATAKFDLSLSMQNIATGLVGAWEYNTDLFDTSTIERMAGHFVTLLEGIVANPKARISQLPLLTQREQHQLLVEWNNTQADYHREQCIHELFEEQVARTPDAVAVVFDNQQLTYQQLNCRANSLAHYLRSLGVGADVLVGICVERSLEMIVGILGILKAGGAYVPLDPDYPTDRLAYMLNDSLLSVLLTQEKLLTRVPEHTARVVCLEQDWENISNQSKDNPVSGSTTDNLAYVIYTSGSTGQPKGTLVNHYNVTRLFAATAAWYYFNQDDVWTLFHSYAFDFSVWEIWGALLYGGRLVVVPYLVTRSPESFYELLCQEKVTVLNQTPSAFRQLIQAEQSRATGDKLNLRLVIFGGEALEINSLQPWFERHGDTRPQLVNMYGITETTVHVTYRPLSKADLHGTANVIGCPIPDLQVYVLDEYLQALPIGVSGEMYVGGAGVTRGYLNRHQLTAERFISNPFAKSKLYKTGDLARYLPNGELEYLGRIDQQVKIRGFRIELGEIEAVMSQHNDVQTCCVTACEDTPGDRRLVAYVVLHQDCKPTLGNELRQFLKEKLPDYMVPNAFVMLESMPLTSNGKVDRRALKAPANISNLDTFVSPRNTIELQLTHIWSKILKLENVGVKDNFFDLGGHSLLVPSLLAQIQQQFGKKLPLTTLFQHPTIEELADVVQKGKDVDISSWSPLVALQPNGSNPPLFCLPGGGGYPFYLYNLARCLGSDQPFYSFQKNHLDSELAPISRVEDVASQYIQALQAVQPQGPYFLAGHSYGGKVVYEIAQQLARQGHAIALVAILDTTAPNTHPQQKQDEADDTTWLINIARGLKTLYGRDVDMDTDVFPLLEPQEQFKYVLEYLKMVDIFPLDADTTYLKQLLQAFKADANANADYVPQQLHSIPIAVFRASEPDDLEEAVNQSELLQDSTWGWSAFSSEPVNVQFVPGSHMTMMLQPHVQVLAQKLKACIEQAQDATGNGG